MEPILYRDIFSCSPVMMVVSFTTHPLPLFAGSSHHDNMSVSFIPPYTPLLYSKTGVYSGIHYFLAFALKHRLWVLVRTASRGGSNMYLQSMF